MPKRVTASEAKIRIARMLDGDLAAPGLCNVRHITTTAEPRNASEAWIRIYKILAGEVTP